MNIAVHGIGYVGLVTATCLAEIGNDVVCFDVDADKIDLLRAGTTLIHERDLPARRPQRGHRTSAVHRRSRRCRPSRRRCLHRHRDAGRPDGSADLQYVLAAARKIDEHMQCEKIVVQKSTAPVGTGERIRRFCILEAVREVNDAQKHVLFDKIVRRFGSDLAGGLSRSGVFLLSPTPTTCARRRAA